MLSNQLTPPFHCKICADKEEQFIEFGHYQIGLFNAKAKEKESGKNEDVVFLFLDGPFMMFAVSDGAGGHPMGKEAANAVSDQILSILKNLPKREGLNIQEWIELANKQVLDLKVGAKATLAMVTVSITESADEFRSFAVGDSEIIYWDKNGNEIFYNIPHSITGHQIEAGTLNQSDSLESPDRHIVTNMLGDHIIKIESSTQYTIKTSHSILIGSDGLFDNISHIDLKSIVTKAPFKKAFQKLKEICGNQENWIKSDDTSFILIRKSRGKPFLFSQQIL